MLTSFFILCAVVGGVLFVCQFAMLLIGFGGEDADFSSDMPDDMGGGDMADDTGHVIDHGSSWLFGAISLRTLVAATLFFGLCGIAAQQANLSDGVAFAIALAGGAFALFGVHWVMKTLYKLGQDSTVHIERAVGCAASVYIPIPPENSGVGKIQIRLQDRLMEYSAMTSATEKLSTGTRVEVVSLISPTTLEVEPLMEPVVAEKK